MGLGSLLSGLGSKAKSVASGVASRYSSNLDDSVVLRNAVPKIDSGTFKIFLFLCLYLAFHFIYDAGLFHFKYTFFRSLIHLVVAILAITLIPHDTSSKGKSIMMLTLYFGLSSLIYDLLLQHVTVLSPEMAVFGVGVTLLFIHLSLGQRLNAMNPAVFYFIISAYFLPFLGNLSQLFTMLNLGTEGFGELIHLFDTFLSPLLFPPYLVYVLFGVHYSKTPLLITFITIIYILFIVYSVFQISGGTYLQEVEAGGISEQSRATFMTQWTDFKVWARQTFWTGPINAFTTQKNETTRLLTGAPIQTEIERGSLRDVSVKLGQIEFTTSKNFAQDVHIFTSDISIKSVDDPLKVALTCKAVSAPLKISGAVGIPLYANARTIEDTVVCTFDEGELTGKKTYGIFVGAQYNYSASAYVERYFVRDGYLNRYKYSDTSPQEQFYAENELPLSGPRSTRTKGPVELNIDAGSDIINLNVDGLNWAKFPLIIQIQNDNMTFDGTIKNIHSVRISLPQSFEIAQKITSSSDELDCKTSGFGGVVKKVECADETLDSPSLVHSALCKLSNTYEFIPNTFTFIEPSEAYGSGVQLICTIQQAEDADTVLKGSPFAIESFYAEVDYEYYTEQKLSIPYYVDIDPTRAVKRDEQSAAFCNIPNAYASKLDYDYQFGRNPSELERFNKIIQLLKDDHSYDFYADTSCEKRSLALALIQSEWDKFEFDTLFGHQYGYFLLTVDDLDYMSSKGVINIGGYDQKSYEDKIQILRDKQQSFDLGQLLVSHLIEVCRADQAESAGIVMCVAGKARCGRDFVYGDMFSCEGDDESLCRYCHDTLIPKIAMLAVQISQQKKT